MSGAPTLKPTDFDDYLERFVSLVGEIEEGQYGSYKNRLVLKMSRAQFEERYQKYLTLGLKYADMLTKSDTIEDTLAVDLKSAEVELLIQSSLFLPFPKF
jgi:hypothetical protein